MSEVCFHGFVSVPHEWSEMARLLINKESMLGFFFFLEVHGCQCARNATALRSTGRLFGIKLGPIVHHLYTYRRLVSRAGLKAFKQHCGPFYFILFFFWDTSVLREKMAGGDRSGRRSAVIAPRHGTENGEAFYKFTVIGGSVGIMGPELEQ